MTPCGTGHRSPRPSPIVAAGIAVAALALGVGAEGQETDPSGEASAQEVASERCQAPEHRQFDFWLGRWEVRNADGEVVGHNEIRRIAGGCGLLESWRGTGGGVGTSVNAYDADLGRWTQRWVGAGATLWLEGELEEGPEGRRMVLEGPRPRSTPRGPVLDRITWTPLPDGRVRQAWEISSDGGESWSELFVGLYGSLAPEGGESASPPPRGDHVDTYHGVRVPDPYRWMEEMEAPETRRWVEGQDRRARDLAEEVEARAALRDEVARLADVRRYRPPWKRGDRYFYITFQSSGGPGTPGTELHLREGLEGGDGAGRVLLAQADLPEGTVLTRIAPGPDGRLVAYGVARDGSRWETLRVFDVERGRPLEDRLEGVHGGASTVVWAPDGGGFYYERFEPPPDAEARTARLENERVAFHAVGTRQEEDRRVFTASAADRGLTVGLGEDGRWLVVTERDPASGGHRVLVADRRAGELSFHPLVDDASASYRFVGGRGDELWFETDRNAPNRKVVVTDVPSLGSSPAGAGSAPVWREMVPEASEAINTWLGARRVGRHLIVGYLVDARTEWRVFGLDGRPLYTLELPRLGPVWSGFQPSVGEEETETFYSLSGLADPGSIYRLDLETGRSTLFARPDLGHDPDEFVTRQVFYEGRDGTRIPMYLVHGRGLERDARAPVIMYGYGFGAWSAEPWFQPHLAAWLRMGGIWALPNIRGGGEYGETWHRAGSGRNRQTAIDDYLAAAEWLIAEGYTGSGGLVLNASSAGGAVGGGALVQRPELFGAAILDYPVLDMLRYDRFTGGRAWRSEYGTAEDPDDFRALVAYSPYHNLRLDRCYPPTLVSPGELDEVTPPLHAYKFVAALQHAQGCDEPILLRVTWGAGHSSGATAEDAVETWADQLSFLVRVLRARGWQPAIPR